MSIAEKLTLIAENQQKVYDNGLKAGEQSVYDAFWDTYQEGGNRTHYSYAFGGKGWTDETFKPKYDIRCGSTTGICMFAYSKITNLKKILEEQGVVLDTSQCTDLGSLFNTCTNLTAIPPIDASNAKHCGSMFYNATHIDGIYLKLKNDGSQTFTSTFQYCNKLCTLRIESGLIGQDISLKHSDLSKESILSVLNALATDASGKTVTFKSSYLQTDVDVVAAINARPTWTISFV